MSDKTLVRGWSISQGDYLRDPEYDDEFIKAKTVKTTVERTIFSFSAVLALGSFFGVMTYFTNFIK